MRRSILRTYHTPWPTGFNNHRPGRLFHRPAARGGFFDTRTGQEVKNVAPVVTHADLARNQQLPVMTRFSHDNTRPSGAGMTLALLATEEQNVVRQPPAASMQANRSNHHG